MWANGTGKDLTMPTVAVISHVWIGHIPAYHRLLTERLLLAGHRVISLAPCGRQDLAIDAGPVELHHCTFGQTPADMVNAEHAVRNPSFARRLADGVGIYSVLQRSGFAVALRAARLWRGTHRTLTGIERRIGGSTDLVVLVYPGVGYYAERLPATLVSRLLPRPWTGIWNGPVQLQTGAPATAGSIFRARTCRAVIVPDPWLRDRLLAKDSDWRVLAMPEIADVRPPASENPQVRRLRAAAGSRRIVGLLGNINRRKGILSFLEMAVHSRERDLPLFFVAAGDFSPTSCGNDYAALAAACTSAPNNFLFLPDRLTDGPEFNAHVDACDVVFAAYIDFPYQSNLLTKAAAFAKPVVVSRGFVMEKRTVEYNLGLVVPQGDACAALDAVCVLLEEKAMARLQPRWSDYLRENSPEALDRLFAGLLAPPTSK